jgi:hypothetical protein
LSTFNSSAIIQILRRRSFLTMVLTLSTLSLVFMVTGRPGHSSSSTSSFPPKNLLCHSKTRARDMLSSP